MARAHFLPDSGGNQFQQGAGQLSAALGFYKERADTRRERREDENKRVVEKLIQKYDLPGALIAAPGQVKKYADDFAIDISPYLDEHGNPRDDLYKLDEETGRVEFGKNVTWDKDKWAEFQHARANFGGNVPESAELVEDEGEDEGEQRERRERTPAREVFDLSSEEPPLESDEQSEPSAPTEGESKQERDQVTRARSGGRNFGPGRVFENEVDNTFRKQAFSIVSSNSFTPLGASKSNAQIETELEQLRDEYERRTGIRPSTVIGELLNIRKDPRAMQRYEDERLKGVQFNSLDSLMENMSDLNVGQGGPQVRSGGRNVGSDVVEQNLSGEARERENREQALEGVREFEAERQSFEGMENEEFWTDLYEKREREGEIEGTRGLKRTTVPPPQSSAESPFALGGAPNVSKSAMVNEMIGQAKPEKQVQLAQVVKHLQPPSLAADLAVGNVELFTSLEHMDPETAEVVAAELDSQSPVTSARSPRMSMLGTRVVSLAASVGELSSQAQESLSQQRSTAAGNLSAAGRESNQRISEMRKNAQSLKQTLNEFGARSRAARARALGQLRSEHTVEVSEAVSEAYSSENADKIVGAIAQWQRGNPEAYARMFPNQAARQLMLAEQSQKNREREAKLRVAEKQTEAFLSSVSTSSDWESYVEKFRGEVFAALDAAGIKNDLTKAQTDLIEAQAWMIGIEAASAQQMSEMKESPIDALKTALNVVSKNMSDLEGEDRELSLEVLSMLLNASGFQSHVVPGNYTRWSWIPGISDSPAELRFGAEPLSGGGGGNEESGFDPEKWARMNDYFR